MKELSIEEKAKRYDEAIKLAKDSYNYPSYPGFIRADVVFPELKESEDEKIRKCLIDLVNGIDTPRFYGIDRKAAIVWLEKQGEQKPADSKIIDLDELVIELEETIGTSPHSRETIKDFFQKAVQKYMKCLQIANGKIGKLMDENYYLKEQKPTSWSEEDELRFEQIDFLIRNSYSVKDYYKTLSDWFKSLKDRVQPQVNVRKLIEKLEWLENTKTTIWSEDDEAMRKTTLQYLENTKGSCAAACVPYIVKCIDWLNSLKDRVQPQPQQQWSEEDEDMRYKATAVINRLCADGKEYVWSISTLEKLFYWLKSLRPQSQWKPSDRELGAILTAIGDERQKGSDVAKELLNIYQQLEKLREE